MLQWSGALRLIAEWTGRLVAFLTLPMVAVTFIIVTLRYVFDLGWIWMQESVVWMHAAVFMLAASYTLARDEHVRVDIFYRGLTARRRALVNLAGALFLLLPMMTFLIVVSLDYVRVSWDINEGSREAGGLPYPFVPLLKSLIPFTALLVIIQGVAAALADLAAIRDPSGDRTRTD